MKKTFELLKTIRKTWGNTKPTERIVSCKKLYNRKKLGKVDW